MIAPPDRWTLVIHGGAGATTRGQTPPETGASLRTARGLALDAGSAILKRGQIALDAVEAAVCVLDDDPPCQRRASAAGEPRIALYDDER